MKLLTVIFFTFIFISVGMAYCQDTQKKAEPKSPVVVIKTNLGNIEITLYPDKAQVTVNNFLSYVKEGFYDSTIFHRVIPGFMIQGGGHQVNMGMKAAKKPIKNEAVNGLSNKRGTIAMARMAAANSASCQFFINLNDNDSLNHKDNTDSGFGYAVFGAVTKGIDVVDKIAQVPTGTRGGYENVPVEPVLVISAKLKK